MAGTHGVTSSTWTSFPSETALGIADEEKGTQKHSGTAANNEARIGTGRLKNNGGPGSFSAAT